LFVRNKVTPDSQTTPLKPIFYNYVNCPKTATPEMPTLLLGHFFHCKRGGLIRRGQQNIKMYILISISCQKRALSNLVLPQQSDGTLKMGDRLWPNNRVGISGGGQFSSILLSLHI
jgi:hypothetical protein